MKQTSTQQVRVPFKMCLVLFLTIFSMMFSKTSSAHNVLYFNPPCFAQGTTASVQVQIANAASGSYFHWQWRNPGGTWTWLAGGAAGSNNTINGRTFFVTNAAFVGAVNFPSGGAQLSPILTIANVGSPAYTTQLNNVQLRVLMTDGLDPQSNAVNTWGGEEFLNGYEAKYISLMPAPASYCYTVCPNNALVVNPASPSLATFYGGFEMNAGAGALLDNFSAPNPTSCVTTKGFYSGITGWAGGALANNVFRIINNPDSMNSNFVAFAPHSGRQMMVINANNSANNVLWYRTIAASGSNYYQGTMSISFWVARVQASGNAPEVTVDVRGATALNGGPTCAFTTIPGTSSVTATVASASGIWQQVTMTFNIPVHTYRKLQFRIRNTNATTANPVSLALDDICLLEPAAGLLPIIMTSLKGTYSNGVSTLSWSTLQESNSNYFDIERSNDGINYTTIGRVYAKGNSDRQTDYTFKDVKVNGGANYYRLKAVSKDADMKNSNTIVLDVKIKGTNIAGIFPNPFMDKVSIAVSSESNSQALIRLFDNTGKLIATQQSNITRGANTVTLENLAKLAKGFYMIKVQVGDEVITQKLIK